MRGDHSNDFARGILIRLRLNLRVFNLKKSNTDEEHNPYSGDVASEIGIATENRLRERN